MNSQGQTGVASGTRRDSYAQIISGIQQTRASTISVPQLSKLLGVKSTTLNARFRRQQMTLKTIGRTNFIPVDLALDLAAVHKYALLGWPTLQQASHLTGVKTGTIKAKCEKGRLEGHKDLTKRLRINPADLENLASQTAEDSSKESASGVQGRGFRAKLTSAFQRRGRGRGTEKSSERSLQRSRPYVLRPAAEPHIGVITARDYGLPEAEPEREVRVEKREGRSPTQKYSDCMIYDPDRPFCVSECAAGRSIRYEQYDGTILKVIDDPFSPKILAKFPHHQHPLMREVLLTVAKSST